MNPQINPYSPPQSGIYAARETFEIVPAGRWRRFWTYWIDAFAFLFLATLLGVIIGLVSGEEGAEQLTGVSDLLLSQTLLTIYYVSLEGGTGRTLGKLVMGTRVVNEDGHPPSLGQVVGRTFARLIPFEALAIFGDEVRTLHDSFTRTYVVKCR
jgi:uncharacterized RDD family membrane protein YckC